MSTYTFLQWHLLQKHVALFEWEVRSLLEKNISDTVSVKYLQVKDKCRAPYANRRDPYSYLS